MHLFLKVSVFTLLALSMYYVAAMLSLSPIRMGTNYPNTVMETQPVVGALRVATGKPLYQDFRSGEEVVPLTYGWLQYMVPGSVGRVPGVTTASGLLLIGRAQSGLAALGCVVMLVLLARARGVPRWFWLIAPLPLFWYPYLSEWMNDFVPDFPALFFSLLGWWVARARGDKTNLIRGAIAACCWTIALHYKPTIIAGPVCFVFESMLRRRETSHHARTLKSLLPLVMLLGLVGLTCFLLAWHYKGLWELNAVSSVSDARWHAGYIWPTLHFKGWYLVCLQVCMLLAAVLLWRRSLLFAAFVALLVFDYLCLGKQGSNTHYLLNSFAVFGVCMAEVAARAWNQPGTASARVRSMTVCTALSASLVYGLPATRMILWEGVPLSDEELAEAHDILRQGAEKVLCLDGYLSLQNGRPVTFADSYHAAMLELRNPALFQELRDRIAAKQYAVIVANYRWFRENTYQEIPLVPLALQKALLSHYELVRVGNWIGTYAPKATPTPAL